MNFVKNSYNGRISTYVDSNKTRYQLCKSVILHIVDFNQHMIKYPHIPLTINMSIYISSNPELKTWVDQLKRMVRRCIPEIRRDVNTPFREKKKEKKEKRKKI